MNRVKKSGKRAKCYIYQSMQLNKRVTIHIEKELKITKKLVFLVFQID
jgi:hypothetical protein